MERKEILRILKKVEEYFGRHSYLQPELECARKINALIREDNRLTTPEAEDIIKIFNETRVAKTEKGCAWIDFQGHLYQLLAADNFKITIDNQGRIVLTSV